MFRPKVYFKLLYIIIYYDTYTVQNARLYMLYVQLKTKHELMHSYNM